MKRFLLLAGVVFAFSAGPSSLPAGDKDDPNFYPLKAGSKWEYKLTAGTQTITLINTIDKSEVVKEETQFVLKSVVKDKNGDKTVGTEVLSTNRQGVFRHKTNNMESVPPVCIIKYPVKPGESWEAEHQIGPQKAKVKVAVGNFQEIQVPAGKYKAISVTLTTMDMGQNVTSTYWFANNVGYIKQTVDTPKGKVTLELEKYDAGK